MKKNTYYGNEENKVISYLEFGAVDTVNSKKEVWDFRLHQKAYDWLMEARYANDLVAYIHMTNDINENKNPINKIIELYKSEIHHLNDASLNLAKLCALAAVKKNQGSNLSFFELGHTLFGCIEGMEFYQKLLSLLKVDFPALNLKEVIWHGVDISPLLNKLSELMHQKYNIKTYDHLSVYSVYKEKTDVYFAKGVSMLYAIRSVSQLMNVLNKSKLCLFDYSFSMDKLQDTHIGTGKSVRYLDFESFYKKYKKNNKSMYVRKNKSSYSAKTKRIFIDCIYGEKSVCRKFIELDVEIRKELMKKLSSYPNALVLLDSTITEKNEWVSIEEFINNL